MSTFDTPMDWLDDTTWDDPWHPVAKQRVESDRVPVGPVRQHLARLRTAGWSRAGIAHAAGITPHQIQDLELVTVAPQRTTAAKVLAVSGPPPGDGAARGEGGGVTDVFTAAFHRLVEAHEPKDPVTRRRRALDALGRVLDQITETEGEHET